MREGGRWFRIGSCCLLLVQEVRRCKRAVAGAGLVATGAETGSCWCRKVIAAAGRWSLVQEGSCWCRLREYLVRLSELSRKRAVTLRGW